ncbi:hypothetical protein DID78_01870 [Candidatus Marinamargulisbacteria bacterium SCGC AG-343-D04]|nr:hypothetical protein DID78_01870 [Candidatus Marinamargulisbacteria bacterium SCGC AG-343-D04]
MGKQSITDVDGVFGHAIHAGIKESGLDLSYIYVPNAVASAAVFTQSKFSASSVTYTKKCAKRHTLKAMIINSGNANAATGKEGESHTKALAQLTSEYLQINPSEVGVASTGIIGKKLPMESIEKHIPNLFKSVKVKNGDKVAEAILTTDLTKKFVTKSMKIGKKTITVSGITKGSGMIAPNMATTLGFLVTNVSVNSSQLQDYLSKAIKCSYNMMSVDTDTSTNDMVVCFATGQYNIASNDKKQSDMFQNLLTEVCIDLAKLIAKDGEGATKLISVDVRQAASVKDARIMAKNVIDSPLVKTAIHGEDPNWGRIMMAIGKDPSVKLNPNKVSIYVGKSCLFKHGEPTSIQLGLVKKELANSEVDITIDCGLGTDSAKAWGCDLTKGYIDINTEYN